MCSQIGRIYELTLTTNNLHDHTKHQSIFHSQLLLHLALLYFTNVSTTKTPVLAFNRSTAEHSTIVKPILLIIAESS
jgi:hypothetical protein